MKLIRKVRFLMHCAVKQDRWTPLLLYLTKHQVVNKPIDVTVRKRKTIHFDYKTVPLSLTVENRAFSKYQVVTLMENHYFQFKLDHSGIVQHDLDWTKFYNLFHFYHFQYGLNTNYCITYHALIDKSKLNSTLDRKIKQLVMLNILTTKHFDWYYQPGLRK